MTRKLLIRKMPIRKILIRRNTDQQNYRCVPLWRFWQVRLPMQAILLAKKSTSQSKSQSVNQKWSLCTSVAVLASPSPDVAFSFGSKSQSVNQKVNQSVKVNQKKVKTKQRNNHEESQ